MRTCVASGVSLAQGLEINSRLFSRDARKTVEAHCLPAIESGGELAEAMEPLRVYLPPFFVPVLRCAEQSGRLDEAFGYLETHCRLLEKPTRAMRNTWLIPAVILCLCKLAQVFVIAAKSSLGAGLTVALSSVFWIGLVVAAVFWLRSAPAARRVWDRLQLSLPYLGVAVRDLAVNRFFHALNLLYSTGGIRVDAMVELAAETANNMVIRDAMLAAAENVRGGLTIGESFATVEHITAAHKSMIQTGDAAGKLDEAFAAISRETADTVVTRLHRFNEVFQRIVVAMVSLSIALAAIQVLSTSTR